MAFFPFRERKRRRGDWRRRTEQPELTGGDYIFQTGIVTEYIAEPDDYLDRVVEDTGLLSSIASLPPLQEITLRDVLIKKSKEFDINPRNYISNPEDAEIMPKNSILAYIIDDGLAKSGQKPFICYPFFPSHFSLPVKPGEHVWIIKEETFGRDIYYWMCRKSGIKQTEDANYTHVERIEKITNQLEANKDTSGNLFENAPDDRTYAGFDNINPTNLPEGVSNDTIVFDSIAYKEEFTGEPVPPIRKKCGDTLLQGSNNSMLHLTTEKFLLTSRDPAAFSGGLGANLNLTGRMPQSPAIDMCVGRKESELNSLSSSMMDKDDSGNIKIIKNLRGKNYSSLENYEIDKTTSISGEVEDSFASIDTSATNCGGRLYLSSNCAIDAAFGSSFDVMTGYGGPAAALYSTNTRVVADGTLRLANRLGESFLDFDPVGNIVMKSSINNGQQFISLMKSGTTRIQAKSGGKIELAVRNNNGAPSEPYILYSELRGLLADMCADLCAINTLLQPVGAALDSAPVKALLQAVGISVDSVNESLAAAGSTKLFAADAKINLTSLPVEVSPLGRIGQENATGMRGTIASTKIFGETNDEIQTLAPEADGSTGAPEGGFGPSNYLSQF